MAVMPLLFLLLAAAVRGQSALNGTGIGLVEVYDRGGGP
jgi:hypothetical protein